jgi:hypothetical protein
MNDENLVPFTSDQSREEAVKNGRAGGIASGQARREQKTMREWARIFGAVPVTIKAQDGTDVNTTTLGNVVAAQLQKATRGDTKAAKFIADLLGETAGETGGLTLVVNASPDGKANIEKLLKGKE